MRVQLRALSINESSRTSETTSQWSGPTGLGAEGDAQESMRSERGVEVATAAARQSIHAAAAANAPERSGGPLLHPFLKTPFTHGLGSVGPKLPSNT
eukprot:6180240-Pleurochrysis_carterae.AAC.3